MTEGETKGFRGTTGRVPARAILYNPRKETLELGDRVQEPPSEYSSASIQRLPPWRRIWEDVITLADVFFWITHITAALGYLLIGPSPESNILAKL